MIRRKRKPRPDGLALDRTRSRPIEKRARRETCEAHLAFVARHRCCVPGCGVHPVHCHHIRVPGSGAAAGRRSSDAHALPVCARHHQGPWSIHATGNEAAWWAARGIDPLDLCRRLVAASVAEGCAPAEWMDLFLENAA